MHKCIADLNFSFAPSTRSFYERRFTFFCIFNALFCPKHDCQDENKIKNLKWRKWEKSIHKFSPKTFSSCCCRFVHNLEAHKSSILIIKETIFDMFWELILIKHLFQMCRDTIADSITRRRNLMCARWHGLSTLHVIHRRRALLNHAKNLTSNMKALASQFPRAAENNWSEHRLHKNPAIDEWQQNFFHCQIFLCFNYSKHVWLLKLFVKKTKKKNC